MFQRAQALNAFLYKRCNVRRSTIKRRCTSRFALLRTLFGSFSTPGPAPFFAYIMHSSFIAATLLYSALDFFIAADALALPLRRATTQSRQSATSGTQALAGLQDGSEYVTNM
jgi:hypothetical protein